MTVEPQTNFVTFSGIGALHLAVGVGLFVDLPIANVSSIASVTQTLGIYGTAALMTAIGVLALCSMLAKQRLVGFGLLVSQQIVLIASGAAGILCALGGHYADGTPANPWHIFVDQLPYLVMTVQHSAAIIQTHAPEIWRKLWSWLR